MNSGTTLVKEDLFTDLERELTVTRKVLERLPQEHYKWKAHEKSMSLGQLATHVATLPDWIRATLAADELDAASAPRPPAELKDRDHLLAIFDGHVAALRPIVEKFDPANWNHPW